MKKKKPTVPISNPPVITNKEENEIESEVNNKLLFDHINKKLKIKIKFKTPNQEKFYNLLGEKEITICKGSAGTGKTFLAITKALYLLVNFPDKYKKIILVKPLVEAGESVGFLPGNIAEKIDPYMESFIDVFEKLIDKRRTSKLLERGYIECKVLAYMRGKTFDNAILIFDEIQNTSKMQLKTALSRIGSNCLYFVLGDEEQSDKFKNAKDNGMYIAMEKLKDIPEISIFEFTTEDIVRNKIIGKILERLNS